MLEDGSNLVLDFNWSHWHDHPAHGDVPLLPSTSVEEGLLAVREERDVVRVLLYFFVLLSLDLEDNFKAFSMGPMGIGQITFNYERKYLRRR